MQDLSVYDVSRTRGFLPDPIQPLSDPYYQPWERLVTDLPDLLACPVEEGAYRKRVEELPVLEMDRLRTDNDWRRTHSIFTFLVASWVWGGTAPDGGPNERVPYNIAMPFLTASRHLGIVPTSTYAGLALYNWTASSSSSSSSYSIDDLSDPENLQCLITFTGTPDEEWFYLISVAIEAAGGASIGLLLDAFNAVDADQPDIVRELLLELGEKIRSTWRILDRIYERCSSHIFYHQMRPFWAGYKGTEKLGSLPSGIFYQTDPSSSDSDGDIDIGEWHSHDGGSAAQSSLYHVFDAGLGVKHITGNLRKMRELMPKKHRVFLDDLEKRANLREYVVDTIGREKNPELYKAYEDAVKALTSFRDAHIRMAMKYIAKASRENSPMPPATPPITSEKQEIHGFSYGVKEKGEGEEASRGTGGTPFLTFLRQIRDETKAAAGGLVPRSRY